MIITQEMIRSLPIHHEKEDESVMMTPSGLQKVKGMALYRTADEIVSDQHHVEDVPPLFE